MSPPPPPPPRGPNYTLLWPLFLGPLIPGMAIALRKYPKYQMKAVFGTAGVILVAAHHSGMVMSVTSKD